MIRKPQKRMRALGSLSIVLSVIAGSALPALGQPVAPSKEPKALEEANKHWQAGQGFYNDPTGHKCEEAVIEFGKAYELSGSVKAARARGICELELERDGAAIADFEIYLANPPKDADPSELQQVQSDTQKLKAVVADLTIRTDKPNTRITAVRTPAQGLPITNHYLVTLDGQTLKLHPGNYKFTAQADGVPDITWSSDIQNASKQARILEFEKAKQAADEAKAKGQPPPPGIGTQPGNQADVGTRPIPVSAWVMGGVTVACIIPTVAFGVLGMQAKSTYDDKNGQASKSELEDLRSDVITKSAVSDVFLGVTIAAAVTTTVLVITRPTVHKKATADFIVAPMVDVGDGRPGEGPALGTGATAFDAGAVMMGTF
jgi:hypothetical protein